MNKRIAVFSSGWNTAILSQYLDSLRKALAKRHADAFLFITYATPHHSLDTKTGEMNIFNLPDFSTFDGVIVLANRLDYLDIFEEITIRCHNACIPIVCQGRELDGAYSILIDNHSGASSICEHLITAHNAKSFAYFAGRKKDSDSNIRLNAVSETLEKHNIILYDDDVYYTERDNNRAYDLADEMCKKNMVPDAVVCVDDNIAMSVILALNANGYRVPEDVKVTGFDNIYSGQIFYPTLTTVDQHLTELGEEGGNVILDILEGKFCPKKNELQCSLVLGESCGCGCEEFKEHMRRTAGRDAFAVANALNLFERKLAKINNTIRACKDLDELFEVLPDALEKDHAVEGDTFHILIDPMFSSSIRENTNKMFSEGYSDEFEVLFSIKNNERIHDRTVRRTQLVPGYTRSDEPRLYIIVPIHEGRYTQGYVVFTDKIEIIENHSIRKYAEYLSTSLTFFRQDQSMAFLNHELTIMSMRDPLTMVKSRNAWTIRTDELKVAMETPEGTEFALAMFDVNNLKTINDSLGHEAGDEYLKRNCQKICDTFKFSSVYRIGGDEFLAVLAGKDYTHRKSLMQDFRKMVEESINNDALPMEQMISVASGFAEYDNKARNESIADVLKRADEEMYKNKRSIKSEKKAL
ncbi:MAG: substrate-binding domain-containing protein [Lachnospiraceae bacterium]|nr:substrate-binding domain-containing protein [Lachnospiraceae bacterium]MBP5250602.1 substrate-binding domain-containing protein [Lachnospiraceae bacterium]